MTVYVDDMAAEFKPKHRPGRTYVMCHIIADTDAELFAMADRIGVARRWHQGDHFDITKSKRALAIAAGARAITLRQLAHMAMHRRRGRPLGTPEQAQAEIDAAHRAAGIQPAGAAQSQLDLGDRHA